MGLFGFGRKKHRDEVEEQPADELDQTEAAGVDGEVDKDPENQGDHPSFSGEVSGSYEGRGEDRGPWDIKDEDLPDYDEYLDMGAFYLPFLKGIELRIGADKTRQEVRSCTISYGSSSLELEAFAAPKSMGLWDDVREELLHKDGASEVEGVFGTEVRMPVSVKGGKTVVTRIVAVDGPRWMLRGIFTGKAATNPNSPETEALNGYFADIVVDRGEEPLAPHDLIPMHPPVSPAERKAAAEAVDGDGSNEESGAASIPDKPTGPFDSDQEVEVKTTLSRGPMFSEVR
ncbi:hypothetical protein CRD60_03550 [Bifidobacterium aemilianum]|uniref:DUF3710 domain-containing protein n=1 Tax=Bifidobacterium aemilianum TaxID=2493120 RepID=A0A366KC40_9BIFI|nr:DUF3710 domain-containing protein [Bifidobacterium aemilianum]RBP98221.1 hypothetical protein CRD60_03550 [Bifidobacterium aemilianum]